VVNNKEEGAGKATDLKAHAAADLVVAADADTMEGQVQGLLPWPTAKTKK
jgi:hypothetical protein